MYGAESVLPVLPYSFERPTGRTGASKALGQIPGVIGVAPRAECEYDFTLLPIRQLKRNLNRPAGIERGANPAREARLSHGGGVRNGSVPAEELRSISANCTDGLAGV